MEKEEQRFVMNFLWLKDWGPKRIHEKLMSTLGDDSYAVSQIKI
jgi:outer membrane biogenesis lipoprotein LolB